MSPNFSPGARLGHYEITNQLGAGGMGEVYLAEDAKLDRKVAIKFVIMRPKPASALMIGESGPTLPPAVLSRALENPTVSS
jgi:serine/threonine protein kinase